MASVTDDFNRADVDPLDGIWETIINGLKILSNVAKAHSAAACVSAIKASSTTFSGDHYSEFVIGNSTAFDYPGCALRCNTTSGGNCYACVMETDNNRFQWRRLTNGTWSNIGTTISYTETNGDVIRASATTNGANVELRVYANTVQQGATLTVSTSVLTGGQPGLYYEFGNSNATTIDTFAAADLAAAASVSLFAGKLGGLFAGKL